MSQHKARFLYVCSPYSPLPPHRDQGLMSDEQQVQLNERVARACCEAAWGQGFVPIAPHLYLPQFVSNHGDDLYRAMSVDMGLIRKCDYALIVRYDLDDGALYTSRGMTIEVTYMRALPPREKPLRINIVVKPDASYGEIVSHVRAQLCRALPREQSSR